MFLGIEIGGTKLQLGVGDATTARLAALVRHDVDIAAGATGILRQIATAAEPLVEQFKPRAVGIGFGGPVDSFYGRTLKSHHVDGWDAFDLVDWCRKQWNLPATLLNDADAAALAEACLGAGRGASPVLYVTVGTGIGAGLVVNGRVYRGHGPAALELGHLRPGPQAASPEQNLEALAAGWGIAAAARVRVIGTHGATESAAELLARVARDPARLSARVVAEAALAGNALASEIIRDARRALAWGLAQVITLLSPEVVVIGGGVSLTHESLFWNPLAGEIERFLFPMLVGSYRLRRPELGEEVVVHGGLLATRKEFA